MKIDTGRPFLDTRTEQELNRPKNVSIESLSPEYWRRHNWAQNGGHGGTCAFCKKKSKKLIKMYGVSLHPGCSFKYKKHRSASKNYRRK